jgi:hypothetical protein
MTDTGTGYDLSKLNLPMAKGQPGPAKGNLSSAGGYDLGKFGLPPAQPASHSGGRTSAAPASGYDLSVFDLPEQIVIPQRTKDGKEASQKIHVRDWGKHTRKQIEDAMDHSPEDGLSAMYFAIGTAKGASLMPAQTMKQFEELGQGFAASKNPKVFFSKSVIPFLNSLTPKRRKP